MNNTRIASLSIMLAFAMVLNCHKEGSEDFLFALTQAPPFVAEITPSRGTPAQTGDRPYPATEVTIKGRNISDQDTKVLFNDIPGEIISNFNNEIKTKFPDDAVSGKIFVIKPGGECLPESDSGFNCSAKPFFVDCYKPYNNEYGIERVVKWGESKNFEYESVETFAFRAEIDPFVAEGASKLRVNCPNPVTIRYFSPSCKIDELILIRDPEIAIPKGRIMQFFMTGGNATCTVSVL
ncbi:MAG: hypothetical protein JJT78_10195 [Leptospira sp.]|nr:hypothetical protein [Leptospira sp.]